MHLSIHEIIENFTSWTKKSKNPVYIAPILQWSACTEFSTEFKFLSLRYTLSPVYIIAVTV